MDSIITTFHVDWKIIIAQAINFCIVFTVLYLFAIKPLKKLMAERSEKIAQGIEDAKCNADALKATKDEYTKIIAEAKSEANDIFTNAKREAEAKKAEMLEDAKKDVANIVENGKKALEGEKAKMLDEAKAEIVSLVVAATEKVLSDSVDSNLEKKLVKNIKNI